MLDTKLITKYGFFVINHLYDLIEADNYYDNSKSIKESNQEDKTRILEILKHEFPENGLLN